MKHPPPPAASPLDDPRTVIVARKDGVTLVNKSTADALEQLPLPGLVIFVHGVNSDGEWYDQTEEGLCQGLNERLRRCDRHLKHHGTEAGQLVPVKYAPELDPDGFLNAEFLPTTFIEVTEHFSPVIRFRWGYKASDEELKTFGGNIYLNEKNYWGGGPFANGCTSIPDLWTDGLDAAIGLGLDAQDINPSPDRPIHSCPPRAYFVLAAYRLARLIETIRQTQPDVPITLVCHSQGNLIGICAAFFGDQFAPAVADRPGSRCVADTYVLCNSPYSLLKANYFEDRSYKNAYDADKNCGRQNHEARTRTLAAFFDILRPRSKLAPLPAEVDRRMGNAAQGFTAGADRARHGLAGKTFGRATLYFNPHDRVIGSRTVQGIGWLGMSPAEVLDCRGEGVFAQRVFAQAFEVGGSAKQYDFWADHHRTGLEPGSTRFWDPVTMRAAGFAVNVLPPKDWKVCISAPSLPQPFVPEALRFGQPSPAFDQGLDPPAEYRDPDRHRPAEDLYDPYASAPGELRGNPATEAALRYEHHAAMRMRARQKSGHYAPNQQVEMEDNPSEAGDYYKAWRKSQISELLHRGVDVQASDHSTIMTNPMHSRRAMAYDVGIGVCDIRQEVLRSLRLLADWRLLDGHPNEKYGFSGYFESGKFKGLSARDWASRSDGDGAMPSKIINKRGVVVLNCDPMTGYPC